MKTIEINILGGNFTVGNERGGEARITILNGGANEEADHKKEAEKIVSFLVNYLQIGTFEELAKIIENGTFTDFVGKEPRDAVISIEKFNHF